MNQQLISPRSVTTAPRLLRFSYDEVEILALAAMMKQNFRIQPKEAISVLSGDPPFQRRLAQFQEAKSNLNDEGSDSIRAYITSLWALAGLNEIELMTAQRMVLPDYESSEMSMLLDLDYDPKDYESALFKIGRMALMIPSLQKTLDELPINLEQLHNAA